MSSWNTARALATPNGITNHLKTHPLGVMKERSSYACTCSYPHYAQISPHVLPIR